MVKISKKQFIRFLKHFAIYLVIGILMLLVGMRIGASNQYEIDLLNFERTKIEEAKALSEKLEADRLAKEALYDYLKEPAEYLAKLIYGQARWNSEDVQKALCWVAINRTQDPLFPDDIISVVQQENQWMGYSDTNPIIQAYYDLAYEVLKTWNNGGYYPFSQEYVYLEWSQTKITIRTTYNDTPSTKYLTFK